MKNGKIRIIIGWILVLIQIFSWFGMSSVYTKLWDDARNTYYYVPSTAEDLTFSQWCTAFEIGNNKFSNSFAKIFADKYEYIPLTVYEQASIMIRDSLGARDGNYTLSLFLFDFGILIGYLFYGILGVFLLVFGYKALNKEKEKQLASSIDNLESKKSKILKVVCIILTTVALIISVLFRFYHHLRIGLNESFFPISLTTLSLLFLFVFFGFYMGRKKSILLSSAIILFAIELIWYFIASLRFLFSTKAEALIINIVFYTLILLSGILYLIYGIKLYHGIEKRDIKKLSVIGAVLAIFVALVWPIILFLIYNSMLVLLNVDTPIFIFAVVITIYVYLIPCESCNVVCGASESMDKDVVDIQEPLEIPKPVVEQNNSEEVEVASQELLFCRKCGEKLLEDSKFCRKCGTEVIDSENL